MRKKISLFCNVESRGVILEKDVDYSIYEVPILLLEQNIDKLIAEKLALSPAECKLDHWRRILSIIKNPENTVEIGIVGKYIELNDAYKSIYESLAHAGIATHSQVKLRKVNSERIEKEVPKRCSRAERHPGAGRIRRARRRGQDRSGGATRARTASRTSVCATDCTWR